MAKRKITTLDGIEFRAPTGPLRIGSDWPGVFLRADEVGDWVVALRTATTALKKQALGNGDLEVGTALMKLDELAQLLKSARVDGAEYQRMLQERTAAGMPDR